MACNTCRAVPRPKKHSFLVIMVDSLTNREGQCVIQSECPHGMQEHMDGLASKGSLLVVDPRTPDEMFVMSNPLVTHVDAKIAAHIPIRDVDLIN